MPRQEKDLIVLLDDLNSVQIIYHLRTHVKVNETMAVNAVVRTANISTAKLVKELELDASDSNLWRTSV